MAEYISSPEERAAAALAEYRGIGPNVLLEGIPLATMEHWRSQCEGAQLSGEQLVDYGWLMSEQAFASLARRHTREAVHSQLLQAANSFADAIESHDSSPRTQAYALLSLHGLYIQRSGRNFDKGLKSDWQPLKQYIQDEKIVASYAQKMLESAVLTDEDVRFGQLLAYLMLIHKTGRGDPIKQRFVAFLVPPRCFMGHEEDQNAYHLSVWDRSRGLTDVIRLSDIPSAHPRIITVPPQFTDIEGFENPQQLTTLKAVLAEHTTKEHDPERMRRIGIAGNKINSYLLNHYGGSTTTKKLAARAVRIATPVGKETSVKRLEALPPAPLDVEGITKDTIFSWYNEQTNGRPLTPHEARKIDKIIFTFDTRKKLESLSTPELLALNRLRVECALALPKEQRKVAISYIHDAHNSLQTIQEQARLSDDTRLLFEAAHDQSMLPFYQILARGELLSQDEAMENYAAIADILGEALWERKQRAKTEEEKTRLAAAVAPLKLLVPPAFNATILGMYTAGEYLALPSLPRQQGTPEIPGWDMSVWRKNEGGNYDVSQVHKIRFSTEGTSLLVHGDVAVVPYGMIDQAFHPDGLLTGLIARLQDDTKAKDAKRFKRRAPDIKKVLIEAIKLIDTA